jgi:hypothetical protein
MLIPAAATVGVVTERNAEQAIEELKAYEVGSAIQIYLLLWNDHVFM